MTMTRDQLRASATFASWLSSSTTQPFVLTGLAGTGKTWLARRLIDDVDMRTWLCAPTGKAALVLSAATGLDVTTVHRILYVPQVDPLTGALLGFDLAPKPTEGDLIVVDEASMVSADMAEDVESSGARVLYIGDPGQLPPVSGGASPVAEVGKWHAHLDEITRQAEGSPIIRLAHMVRAGRDIVDAALSLDDERIAVIPKLSTAYGDALVEAGIEDTLLVTSTNVWRAKANEVCRDILGHTDELPDAGELVLALRNGYDPDGELFIANGETVVVDEHGPSKGHLATMHVRRTDGKVGWLTYPSSSWGKAAKDIPYSRDVVLGVATALDYGYAYTCHKAQGSQASHVIVMPDRRSRRDPLWAYTAITRAVDSVAVVARR